MSHHVRLGARELMRARASSLLALDPRAFAAGVELADEPPSTLPVDTVAIVSILGPLAQRASADLCGYVDGYDAVTLRFIEACLDPRVTSIVLRLDSPGGDVAGLEVAISRMIQARELSRKPVYAYIDELAASAAYWLAACVATSGIYLPIAGSVGSIGVLAALVDETKALAREGLAITLVRDPPGKAEGHPAAPLAALALARTQELVRVTSGRFASAVADARGLAVPALRRLDGALLGGPQAVAAGLADGIAGLEEVVAMASGSTPPSTTTSVRSLHTSARSSGRSPMTSLSARRAKKDPPMKRKRIGAFDAPADPVAEPITCPSCDYRFDRDDEAAKSDRPDDVDDLVQCPKCKLQFVAPSSDDDDEGAPSREEEARVAAIAARYGMPLTAVRQAAREVARATIPTMAQQAQQTAARRSSR